MGVVWLADDDVLGEPVALKFLPEVVARDEVAVDELKTETRRARRLTHPHIVRIHDFVQGENQAAVSMEFVDGSTLGQLRLAQPGKVFAPAILAPLVAQLCAALDYAHADAKIVHRDLKPANVLVTRDGKVKVTDFGIARSLTETHTRLTGRVGGTSGTLLYMSPQQLAGDKPTAADDIYSLGATLYELLAGKPPFYRGDGIALMGQIRERAPGSLTRQRVEWAAENEVSAVLPPIPPTWEETVLACLAKEPQDRPRSAGEVAKRLELAPGEKDWRPPGVKETDANPPPAGTAPAGHSPSVEPALPPLVPPAAAKSAGGRGSRWPLVAGLTTVFLLLAGLGGWYFGVYRAAQSVLANVHGGVIVTTTPAAADVQVEGFPVEKSPATFKEVEVGKRAVVVRLAGYEEDRREVDVRENQFTMVDVALVRSTGTLQIASVPGGLEVTVAGPLPANGAATGGSQSEPAQTQQVKTPTLLEKLPTGDYELTFRRGDWPEQKQNVTVERNQTVAALAEFVGGSLVVTSTPSGATVWRDDRQLGATPLNLSDVVPGTVQLEFRLDGYKATTQSGEVRAKETAQITAALEPLPSPQVGQPWTIPDLELALQPIAAGSFTMGSPDSEAGRDNDEGPQTHVTISRPFWLGRTEVTQGQWQAVMEGNPSSYPNAGTDAPVENVSWNDAMSFCQKLTAREKAAGRLPAGYVYTLPTEAQWEYACRAGTTTMSYAGDFQIVGEHNAPGVDGIAWYGGNSGVDYDGADDSSGWSEMQYDHKLAGTHPVAKKQANAWGLYDMLGNVWEWCTDFYQDHLPGGTLTDPVVTAAADNRVMRGGSYSDSASSIRSAYRSYGEPTNTSSNVGFRVALAPSP